MIDYRLNPESSLNRRAAYIDTPFYNTRRGLKYNIVFLLEGVL